VKRQQPERAEQEGVKKLLRTLGARFFVAGTVRKKGDHPGTMQTPGLADIPLCFLPRRSRLSQSYHDTGGEYQLVVIEVKSPAAAKTKSGGLRPEQADLKNLCAEAGVPYIHGDLNAIIAWLIENRYLKASQVPHYRT
jgi:hypothetical protein